MESFLEQVKLPALATEKTKKVLFIASHLGSSGLTVYQSTNEGGFNDKIKQNVNQWKKSNQTKSTLNYYHGQVHVLPETWKSISACLKCDDEETNTEQLNAKIRQEPIMKEIISQLKNKETLKIESLASIYLSLFQPSFEDILDKNLDTERNNVKQNIFQIRQDKKYNELKPNKQLLKSIFELVN
jgi:hypothetical protein